MSEIRQIAAGIALVGEVSDRVRARDPQPADRVIARKAKVSHPDVAKVRADMEAAGTVETVTTRIGADGVAQPAKRKYTRRFTERSAR